LYLFQGANVGDALLRSTRLLKWLILNIGDPLYRPFPNGARVATPQDPELMFALAPQITLADTATVGMIGVNPSAPERGLTFSVKTDRPDLVEAPRSVSIAPGTNAVRFPIQARAVHDDATTVRISVSANDLGRSNTLILFPVLGTLELSPGKLHGSSSASGIVTLRRAAPASGITVTLSTSNPAAASVEAQIQVPEGQSKVTFQITTARVAAETSSVITASYAGVARKATLTVIP
jgi:hypothetical protein